MFSDEIYNCHNATSLREENKRLLAENARLRAEAEALRARLSGVYDDLLLHGGLGLGYEDWLQAIDRHIAEKEALHG